MRTVYIYIILTFTLKATATEVYFERFRIGHVTYEAASAFDVDNNGSLDIVSGEYWFEGPAGKFSKHLIHENKQGHGLGFGDINGDNRCDFILANGWLQAPKKLLKTSGIGTRSSTSA